MRKIKNEELGRLTVDEFKSVEKLPVIIILDNVRSLHNIGSVFRSADSFLVEAIYLCGISARPPHREMEKTALGATESVTWRYFENTVAAVEELKNQGYRIVAIEQAEGGIRLDQFNPVYPKYAFVFGHEINGVGEEVMKLADEAVEIPQFGTKHSLNIAVCAGIVLWEASKKLKPGH